jgi:hypothetical protein
VGGPTAISTRLTLALVEGVVIPHLAAKVNLISLAALIAQAKIGDAAASPMFRSGITRSKHHGRD